MREGGRGGDWREGGGGGGVGRGGGGGGGGGGRGGRRRRRRGSKRGEKGRRERTVLYTLNLVADVSFAYLKFTKYLFHSLVHVSTREGEMEGER